MIGKGKSNSRLATMPEVLETLEERKAAGGEQGYEQELSLEYAKKFSKLDVKEAKKMKDELTELGISEKTATKLIEIMPLELIQLRQALIIEKKPVEDETVTKIFEVINKYRGK